MLTWNKEQDPRFPTWLNNALNTFPFLLPEEACYPLLMASCGFKEKQFADNPWRYVGLRLQLGGRDLFWNSILSVSISFPFCIALQIRWSATASPSYFQFILGWKPNGRFATTFRIESDADAAAGYNSANPGEAQGWVGGVK